MYEILFEASLAVIMCMCHKQVADQTVHKRRMIFALVVHMQQNPFFYYH